LASCVAAKVAEIDFFQKHIFELNFVFQPKASNENLRKTVSIRELNDEDRVAHASTDVRLLSVFNQSESTRPNYLPFLNFSKPNPYHRHF
jgi:hypothetical protein